MKAMVRRLCSLEERFTPPEDKKGRRLVELLRERKRRDAEERGEIYVPHPRENLTGRTIAEVLQMGRSRNAAQAGPERT
jgi:hypothetical protein